MVAALVVLLASGCGQYLGVCYVANQRDVDEKISDKACRELWTLNYQDESLQASSERTDISLSVAPGDEDSRLKHVTLDHVAVGQVAGVESITVTRYQRGSMIAESLDLTFDESPIVLSAGREIGGVITFIVKEGGSVRLQATAPMDGWRRMHAKALPSWEGVTVEIDPAARPVTELTFGGEGMSLGQLQQFGALAQVIHTGPMPTDLLTEYVAWLESEGFVGTLTTPGADGELTTILPRPTNP